MGKALIIKGADFSVNAVEQLPVASPFNKTGGCVFFLDYQGDCAIRRLKTSSANRQYRCVVVDVQALVGSDLQIYSANPVVADAYYACFSSDLGTLSYDDIPDVQPLPNTDPGNMELIPITKVGNSFNISSANNVPEMKTVTVPSGAKYLVFTANLSGGLRESDISVFIV